MIALLLVACTLQTELVASVTDGGMPPEPAEIADPAEALLALYEGESDGTRDAQALPLMDAVAIAPTGRASGELAPVGSLPLVDGAGTFDLADLVGPDGSGRAVLVAFMASWCAPCEASLPTLAAIEDRWAGQLDIVIYDIDVNAIGRRKLLDRLREVGVDAPVVVAPPFAQRAWLGEGQQVPRFFFVNQAGRILTQDRGFDDGVAAQMPRQIELVLANPFGVPR